MVTREIRRAAALDRGTSILGHLSSHRVFGALPESVLAEFASEALERTFARGHQLFYERDPVVYVYLLLSGVVAMTHLGYQGNAHSLLTFTAGDLLGIAALMFERRWTVNGVAVSNTAAILLSVDRFEDAYRRHREFAHQVTAELACMFLRSQEVTFNITQTSVTARVAKFLIDAADERSDQSTGAPILELKLSYHELALMLGTTRETITRAVARLSRSGLVDLRGRHVRILKPDALRRLTEI